MQKFEKCRPSIFVFSVMQRCRFLKGVVTADGPLTPLIGWAVGQKQFLMERGVWPEGGLKGKCGAKAKDHTGTCCATGLMYICGARFSSEHIRIGGVDSICGPYMLVLTTVRVCSKLH